jgi:hypothetical protein
MGNQAGPIGTKLGQARPSLAHTRAGRPKKLASHAGETLIIFARLEFDGQPLRRNGVSVYAEWHLFAKHMLPSTQSHIPGMMPVGQ